METENAVARIETKVTPWEALAGALVVASTEALEIGQGHIQDIKALRDEVQGTFRPIIKKAHGVWKEAIAQENKYILPLDTAENIIRSKMNGYLLKLETDRTAEERRLKEIAEKDAAARLKRYNDRIVVLMEKAGGIQEQKDELEIALGSTENEEEATLIRSQISALDAKLSNVTEQVRTNEVKAVQEAAPITVHVDNAPKVEGMGVKKTKIPTVNDGLLLARVVADGKVPISVIDWNMATIKKLVNAGMVLPGVSYTEEMNVNIRGRR